MKTRHTPEPWERSVRSWGKERRDSDYYGVFTQNQSTPYLYGEDIAHFFGPDAEANSSLFMAAPNMKAALELIKQNIQ